MNNDIQPENESLIWSSGAWFGSQIGSTVWLVPYGIVLLFEDALVGVGCLVSFFLLNAWGYSLWNRRTVLSFSTALTRWMIVWAMLVPVMAVINYARGITQSVTPWGTVVTRMSPTTPLISVLVTLIVYFQFLMIRQSKQ